MGRSVPQCLAQTSHVTPFTRVQAMTSGLFAETHWPQVRKLQMFLLCNHGSCTNTMLVCSFASHLASTAEALLQFCSFICVKAIETGAIVTTSWSLLRAELLLPRLSGLRHRNYLIFTCFLLRFHRLLVNLITIPLAPVHTVRPFEATEWSLWVPQGL